MFKNVKRILAAVLASAMVLATGVSAVAAPSPTGTEEPKYEDNEDGAVEVTGSDATEAYTHIEGYATISKIKKSNKKTYTTPAQVKYNGLTYIVNGVRNGLFKNATKATKIVLGKTITNLQPKAFAKLPKTVKTIQFKATKIQQINKNAFKGLKKSQAKKITVIINKKMDSKSYKKLVKALKKAGFKNIKKK
jgi:biopolymer transport protein ExbD